MKRQPRIHEYPAEYYLSAAEFRACRRIYFWHAVIAWAVVGGLGLLAAAAWAILLG